MIKNTFSKITTIYLIILTLGLVQSVVAQTSSRIIIFRDTTSLTIYVLEGQDIVSLKGIALRSTTGESEITRQLDTDYAAFLGLPFENIGSIGAVCFRLLRDMSSAPVPLECQGATQLFIQRLAASDIFWYDAETNTESTIFVVFLIDEVESFVGICPAGQQICEMSFVTPVMSDEGEAESESLSNDNITGDCSNLFDIPMVFVPQATFFMGLADDQIGPTNERPGRNVTVNSFCIDVFEVTNARYAVCVNAEVCEPPRHLKSRTTAAYYDSEIYARFPVINVTWQQAQTYCEYRDGRLPTEAEWELVSRYDPETRAVHIYPWGDQMPESKLANYGDRNIGDTVEIGQNPDGVSAYGVHDLSGNVAEWVYDWYANYDRQDVNNPVGPEEGLLRAIRGGSFDDLADEIRSGFRGQQSPSIESDAIGFRCVIPKGD